MAINSQYIAALENGDRVYSISGLSHDVSLAEHEISRFISLQPVYSTLEILIPNDYVGAVIGTKGETVRSLQERSRAKIKIDPKQDPEVGK
jgi:polyribonucleotide nucleotidyltransferase